MNNPSRPNGSQLLSGIQLLRGVSALLVVAAHINMMMGHSDLFGASPLGIREVGLFGVAIFFVISGFIIAIVSLDGVGRPRLSRAEFARRRVIRIVPFLWVSVIGYNLLSLAGTHIVEWIPMARALAVWPVGELKPNVVWSLRHEFLFYALFALLALGSRPRLWLLVPWFLAPLICWPILLATGSSIPFAGDPWSELFQVVLLGARSGANLQFGAGFLIGWLYLRGYRAASAPRLRGLAPTLAAALIAAWVAEEAALPIGLERSVLWTALAAPPVWLAVISTARDGWLSRAGNALGDASFSLYLVHNGVVLTLFHLALHLREVPLLVIFVVILAAATLAGMLVHRWVERPLIKALAHGRPLAPWLRRWRAEPR